MKKKAYLIFLVLGLALLAVGVFFFGRICAVKDSIYAKYSLSFSDASIQSVFINDHDEAAVKADFDAAVLQTAISTEETATEAPEAAEATGEAAPAAEAAVSADVPGASEGEEAEAASA